MILCFAFFSNDPKIQKCAQKLVSNIREKGQTSLISQHNLYSGEDITIYISIHLSIYQHCVSAIIKCILCVGSAAGDSRPPWCVGSDP